MSSELFEILVSFEASLAAAVEPGHVLQVVADRLPGIMPALSWGCARIDEDTLLPTLVEDQLHAAALRPLLSSAIERGMFALALRRGQPVSEELPDGGLLLLQAVATPNHIAGILIAITTPAEATPERLAALALATARAGAAHENLVLHAHVQQQNRQLEARVAERTRDLAAARDRAEDASKAKSAFLATMSHELRTPLNGIIGMAELLLGTENDHGRREQLGIVRTCAEDLLGQIDGVLDLSRIEAGRLELTAEPCDPAAVALHALRTVAPRAQSKGLWLAWNADDGFPAKILTDPGRLRQVLVNLLGNAVKFTERGGVSIRASARRDGMRWSITLAVTDTGPGISPEIQARLFTPFEQGDASINRRFGGTGLGLSISRRLCDLMHGGITVSSRVGAGSTFTATLQAEVLADGDAPAPIPQRGRALLLGPPGPPADATTAALRQAGYAVVDGAGDVAVVDGAWSGAAAGVAALPAGLPVLVLAPLAGAPAVIAACTGRQHVVHPVPADPAVLGTIVHALASGSSSILPVATTPVFARNLAGMRVLAADDQAVNRRVIAGMLAQLGIEPVLADGGAEAARLAGLGRYDVVLLDLQMPEVDGFTAAERIRAAGITVPLVAVTAHAMAGDREEILARGFDGYLAKPVRLAELAELLSRFPATGLKPVPAAATGQVTAAPAKRDRLDELRIEIGADILGEVIQAMLAEGPELIAKASAAAAAGDLPTVAKRAHALKGDAANLGQEALAGLAKDLEHAANAGEGPRVRDLVAALPAAWEACAVRLAQARSAG